MCDPVSATIAAVAVGSTVYSNEQQKKAANAAQNNANQQAELTRQAEAERAAEERSFQEQQTAAQRAWEEEQRRVQQEQLAAQQAFQQELQRQQQEAIAAQRAAAEAEAERVRQEELRRQQNIAQGQGIISNLFGQFDSNFYGQRSQAYTDYAKPQLDQQYSQAMQSLVRALARGGNLNSSVRAQSMSDLQQQYDRGLISISDQANQYSNQARSAIESARGSLLSQNASLADPGVIRDLALSQVSALSAQPAFSPLASLISAFTRGAAGNTPITLPASSKESQPAGIDLFSSAPSVSTGRVVN